MRWRRGRREKCKKKKKYEINNWKNEIKISMKRERKSKEEYRGEGDGGSKRKYRTIQKNHPGS